jgi:hypothetical protein
MVTQTLDLVRRSRRGARPPRHFSEEAGAALLEAWHGATLCMKIDRSPAPLERMRLTSPFSPGLHLIHECTPRSKT